jgi:ubiquinone/menaquinone biosynthesis C-methylase UbiE
MDKIMSTAEKYDVIAKEYYENRKAKQGNPLFLTNFVTSPSVLKLLGNVTGKKILDVGCGPGLQASLLTKNGAIVKGMDGSREFIEIAKKEAPAAAFIIGDAEKKLPFLNSEFDIVIATMVLHHLNLWDVVLKEIHEVLKKGGIFIFLDRNPVTRRIKRKKWFFKKFSVIENYFDEGAKYRSMGTKNKDVKLVQYHKTYETIIKLLIKHGFEIIDYEDCKPLPEAKELFPAMYKMFMNQPLFCVWKVRKI